MLAESQVPISERYLRLEGRASKRALGWSMRGFGRPLPARSVVVFAGFAYADLPIGKLFTVAFRRSAPEAHEFCELRIAAVTQQFAKPFPEVPHGWKTICCLTYEGTPPQLISSLPTVDEWYETPFDAHVCISTPDTWQARLRLSADQDLD